MLIVLVIVLAVVAATMTYGLLEGLGRRGWAPAACRAVAWAAIGILLVNASCPTRQGAGRPLVLLDASLSMGVAGGRWAEARDSAMRWGSVRGFGDEAIAPDSTADRGRSLLAPALQAAAASGRPVIVVTDGEIEDAGDIPPDLLARAGVRLFSRVARRDLAIVRVSGPGRVTVGDTVELMVEVSSVLPAPHDSARIEARLESRLLARAAARLEGGAARLRLRIPSSVLPQGESLLRVTLIGAGDTEPRDDARTFLASVAPNPGVVLLAAPADWDSRQLYRTLKDVAQLPLRGYVRLEPDRWRSMTDLSVVPEERVREAARRADLLILKGATGKYARGSRAKGIWRWPSGEEGGTVLPGDWYARVGGPSPLAGAFAGLALDSFPPAASVLSLQPGRGDWVGLTAQEGRHGTERPIVFGGDSAGARRIVVAADGFWRWAFRGGASEEGYRAWVAGAASWLLGGADSASGLARPARAVVPNARPVVFEWVGTGAPRPLAVALQGGGFDRRDTLRFDGAGRAELRLPVGEYRYALEGGTRGLLAVEEYSDEWLPRQVMLPERPTAAPALAGRSSARDWLWLFAVAVLALAGEWVGRRRLGLR